MTCDRRKMTHDKRFMKQKTKDPCDRRQKMYVTEDM